MKVLRSLALLPVCLFLTGCFQFEVVHVVHRMGESDTGAYRLKILKGLVDEDQLDNMVSKFRQWSRPEMRRDSEAVYIEDNTGGAKMEHFYDSYNCQASIYRDRSDCHFAFALPQNVANLAGWSINWEVVLQPDMTLISSNHHQIRRTGGLTHLVWNFDGNRRSDASVDFVVRVPRAR